ASSSAPTPFRGLIWEWWREKISYMAAFWTFLIVHQSGSSTVWCRMAEFRQHSWPAILLVCLLVVGTREGSAQVRGQADASAGKVERLIRQLGAEGFRDREAADKALKSIGEQALEPLRKAARGNPDPEVRRRAKALVESIAAKVRQAKLARL